MRTAQGGFAAGQFFVGLLQAFLELFALGDVPEDALDADDAAGGVVDGSLDDIDEELFAEGRFILLNGLKNFASANDVTIIALILGGEFGRIEIEVGFAD